MKVSVFVGVSLDGFIARKGGELDFLPPGGNPEYHDFKATLDAIVIGRKTFEKVLEFGGWFYGKTPVFVLSRRQLDMNVAGGVVESMSSKPQEVIAEMARRGFEHVNVDGGLTIQEFLRCGLVTSIVITHVPVLIGEGIPLFGSVQEDIKLKHVQTKTHAGGLVTSEYAVTGKSL